MLATIDPPAGLHRNGTPYANKNRWIDGKWTCFEDKVVKPIGGWTARSTAVLSGVARAILTWRDSTGVRNIAVGTHTKLYRMNEAGILADITPVVFTAGNQHATVNIGFGGGPYGAGAFGTPRPDTGVYTEATTWSLDHWGDYLVAVATKDGRLLEWTGNTSTPAAVIVNAPTACRSLIVTENRFLFALGAGGNVRKVQWSDFQNNTVWTPTALNQAGDEDLQTSGQLMCGARVGGGLLLLTDVDAHLAEFVGYPTVWRFGRVGDACGIVSQKALVTVDQFAVWMGRDGFHVFDGYTRPLDCSVKDYVFGRLNDQQRSKVQGFALGTRPEVWWLYPSEDGLEIDSYVAWNYRENHWTFGPWSRTCGAAKGTYSTPLMVGTDGLIYEHETGLTYDGTFPYVEGLFEIGQGERVLQAVKLFPDEATPGDVTLTIKSALYPNTAETTSGPYTLSSPTSIRALGRQMRLRFTGARPADWRIGKMRLELKARGTR